METPSNPKTEDVYKRQNHQYIIVKHSGTEKNRRQAHLHILANRMTLSGELYKDNWIGNRATEAANTIARERNLVQSKDIRKANREEIKQAMDGVVARMQGFDLAGFSREVGKLGFKVREARASTCKLNGYYVEARSGTEYKMCIRDRYMVVIVVLSLHRKPL